MTPNDTNSQHMKNIDYRRLIDRTKPGYSIKACRFDTYDCRDTWVEKITHDGRCLVLQEHDIGRSLSVVIEYDPIQWTAGWRLRSPFACFFLL